MTVEVSETYRYELRACGCSVFPPRSFLAPTKVLCTKHPEEVTAGCDDAAPGIVQA
jgi:hypothetical protein